MRANKTHSEAAGVVRGFGWISGTGTRANVAYATSLVHPAYNGSCKAPRTVLGCHHRAGSVWNRFFGVGIQRSQFSGVRGNKWADDAPGTWGAGGRCLSGASERANPAPDGRPPLGDHSGWGWWRGWGCRPIGRMPICEACGSWRRGQLRRSVAGGCG
jgi:hypothetical protein